MFTAWLSLMTLRSMSPTLKVGGAFERCILLGKQTAGEATAHQAQHHSGSALVLSGQLCEILWDNIPKKFHVCKLVI